MVNTYYFDASDGGPTDPDGVWTNDANAFDGDVETTANTSTNGSTSSNYLLGEGTNAPSSGGVISQVRVRAVNVGGAGGELVVYTDGLSESLVTHSLPFVFPPATATTSFEALTEPSGGWTWEKLQALEVKIYATGGAVIISRVEIEVTSEDGTTTSTSSTSSSTSTTVSTSSTSSSTSTSISTSSTSQSTSTSASTSTTDSITTSTSSTSSSISTSSTSQSTSTSLSTSSTSSSTSISVSTSSTSTSISTSTTTSQSTSSTSSSTSTSISTSSTSRSTSTSQSTSTTQSTSTSTSSTSVSTSSTSMSTSSTTTRPPDPIKPGFGPPEGKPFIKGVGAPPPHANIRSQDRPFIFRIEE